MDEVWHWIKPVLYTKETGEEGEEGTGDWTSLATLSVSEDKGSNTEKHSSKSLPGSLKKLIGRSPSPTKKASTLSTSSEGMGGSSKSAKSIRGITLPKLNAAKPKLFSSGDSTPTAVQSTDMTKRKRFNVPIINTSMKIKGLFWNGSNAQTKLYLALFSPPPLIHPIFSSNL